MENAKSAGIDEVSAFHELSDPSRTLLPVGFAMSTATRARRS